MLALFSFLIMLVGSLNWLCIGFFQYDFVAGIFGTQSSIFSRFVYIIIGIAALFLTYAIIRYKGRLTIKKNKNQDNVLMNKQPLPQSVESNQNVVNYNTNNSNINSGINENNPNSNGNNTQGGVN